VLFLATFLGQLNPSKLPRKVLPIKKLVKLLNSIERSTQQACAVKAAATLLLLVCSDAGTAGCAACWKYPPDQPRHRQHGVCACTTYSEWLSYEFQVTRSLVSHGALDEAFEVSRFKLSVRDMSDTMTYAYGAESAGDGCHREVRQCVVQRMMSG
jgi:hypothetical protein